MVSPSSRRPVLEQLQRHAALRRGLHVVGVDVEDAVHARAVEHDRVLDHGLEAAFGRRAARAWHHVHAVLVGERQHSGRLLGAPHHRDRGGWRQRVDAEDVLELAEVVDAAPLEVGGVGDDVVRTEDLLEVFDDRCSAEGHGESLW